MKNENIENKIFVEVLQNGYCSFYATSVHAEIPESALEISDAKHLELLKGLNEEQKLVYIDTTVQADSDASQIKLRNKFTIWDEITQSYIPDEMALLEHQKIINKANAQQLYNDADKKINNHTYRKLSEEQQAQFDDYMDALLAVIDGKDTLDVQTITPLDFL